jgi:hypothetical protein
MQVYTFEATFIDDGIETESVSISASNLDDAIRAAVDTINGVNSFAECLLDLQLLFITPDQD